MRCRDRNKGAGSSVGESPEESCRPPSLESCHESNLDTVKEAPSITANDVSMSDDPSDNRRSASRMSESPRSRRGANGVRTSGTNSTLPLIREVMDTEDEMDLAYLESIERRIVEQMKLFSSETDAIFVWHLEYIQRRLLETCQTIRHREFEKTIEINEGVLKHLKEFEYGNRAPAWNRYRVLMERSYVLFIDVLELSARLSGADREKESSTERE